MRWTPEEADNYLLGIVEKMELIKPYEVTILTGSNGSGKSLIRKGLPGKLADDFNVSMDNSYYSTSLEKRMQTFTKDDPWNPTSVETFREIKWILSKMDRFIIMDEPELGSDEDVQVSIINMINDSIKEVYDKGEFKGCLIITHSKLFVRKVRHHKFINLDGLNEDDWLDRQPEPRDLDELVHNSKELYDAVDRRIKILKSLK